MGAHTGEVFVREESGLMFGGVCHPMRPPTLVTVFLDGGETRCTYCDKKVSAASVLFSFAAAGDATFFRE